VVGAVGLTLPRGPYYDKELEFCISRSYGPGRYDSAYEEKGIDYPYGYVRWTENRNMRAFLRLVAEHRVQVRPLISHTFALEQAASAYDLITGKSGQPFLGVLFRYHDEPTPVKPAPEATAPSSFLLPIPIGVLGAGNFAQSMLLPYLKADPRARLEYVVTQTPLRAMDVKERFAFNRAGAISTDLLHDDVVRAVLIATRHDSHASLACKALLAGKSVFLEKPAALSEAELDELEQVYRSVPHPFLMLGFNRRFAPAVHDLLTFLAPCREPRLITYRVNAGQIPLEHWTQDPEQGGGRITGEACHFIDLLGVLANNPAVSVYAQALPDLGKYRQDNFSLTLRYADGTVATLHYTANGDRALPKEQLEIFCQGRAAVLRDFRELRLYAGGKEKIRRYPGQDKGHRAEMSAWLDALEKGLSEPVPFAQSLAVSRLTFATLRSLREGTVITL
jgi:predicted dehydrogenase